MKQFQTDLKELEKGFNFVVRAITTQSSKSYDKVKEKLEPFKQEYTPIIEELKQDVGQLESKFKETSTFYCYDPSAESEEFLGKFNDFMDAFEKGKANLEKQKAEAEKKARLEERKQKELQRKAGQPPAALIDELKSKGKPNASGAQGKLDVNQMREELANRRNLLLSGRIT